MRSLGSRQPTLNRRGRLFVLSAPSGSGKTTVLKALMKRNPAWVRSISITTRPPRAGERQGKDYRFLSRSQFQGRVAQGAFLEYARVVGNWYGTPKAPIQRALRAGRNALLGVDIQGARKIRRSGLPLTTIFLLPPSKKILRERLQHRGTETTRQIRARLQSARRELKEVHLYDYAVVNDRLKEAISAVETIIRAEQFRVQEPVRAR